MARVIDTDIFSFLLKKDSRAELYKPHIGRTISVSFLYDGGRIRALGKSL